MSVFILWAAACALVAVLLVILPLLRHRKDAIPPQFALAMATGVLLALAAAILYPLWSNWPWRAPPATGGNDIAALLAATNDHPDDVQAWVNLGQGYLRITQWPLARRSFQHADRLSHGTSVDALNGLGETIVFEGDNSRAAEAAALFERALKLDPHSPQALFYTGVAALNSGDLATARSRFVELRDLGPPPEVLAALDKQIAAIDADIARQTPDPATSIHLQVTLTPALAASVPKQGTLFVFVRAPQGGPPLAVKRLNLTFPQRVDLSANDSMIASNRIKPGQRVEVMARISASGTPTQSTGDLYGALTAVAGGSALRELAIDQRSP
jgi:cytochrome c-type biogenesis protein CcmH